MYKVPLSELENRMHSFKKQMDFSHPDWEMAVIFTNINMYYFTGTMQDGVLLIPREEEPTLWVRRSYERALNESLFDDIRPMKSFRDAALTWSQLPSRVYLETEFIPLGFYQRFLKHFPFKEFKALDRDLGMVRGV
ncbi:MAG: aminopeptidase P family N-terminal domain-containing protein, partial [Methanobacterium sp.]|nr:aminopeptidase P family N-terminal domain-containing protein [Euryarchaeota archaeon]MBV1729657.1 aminopeptidase P family N-terminal domain-containing protein [Methanobacterium sp.]